MSRDPEHFLNCQGVSDFPHFKILLLATLLRLSFFYQFSEKSISRGSNHLHQSLLPHVGLFEIIPVHDPILSQVSSVSVWLPF